jgi:hypothetical protein
MFLSPGWGWLLLNVGGVCWFGFAVVVVSGVHLRSVVMDFVCGGGECGLIGFGDGILGLLWWTVMIRYGG